MSQSYWFRKSNIAIIKERHRKKRLVFNTTDVFKLVDRTADAALPDLVIFTRVVKFRRLIR